MEFAQLLYMQFWKECLDRAQILSIVDIDFEHHLGISYNNEGLSLSLLLLKDILIMCGAVAVFSLEKHLQVYN